MAGAHLSTVLRLGLFKPPVRVWLKRCFDTGFAHGADLVMAEGADSYDWVVTVRDILLAMEARGWIRRGKRSPTRDQDFLNSHHKSGSPHYAEVWGWSPNWDCADAHEYLGAPESLVQGLRQGLTYEDIGRRRMFKPTIVTMPVGDDPPEARLYYGLNVREALRLLPDDSTNCVATSPPYWSLRDYGVPQQVWGGDHQCQHEWGDDVPSKGQSGGTGKSTLGFKGGSDTRCISDEGVERSLARSHVKPRASAFCTKCDAWRGCLGLEPTPELFVKHMVLIGQEIWRVLHSSGTFWLNLGSSYMSHAASAGAQVGGKEGWRQQNTEGYRSSTVIGRPKAEGWKDKDLVGIPWMVALALQADGWWLRNEILWQKANAMPSSVADRFTPKHEHIFLLTKSSRYYFDLDAVRVPHTYGTYDDEGNFEPAQNWFESGEGQRKMDQTQGQLGTLAGSPRRFGRGVYNSSGKNPGTVWRFATTGYKGAHFAVWPPALVEQFVKAGSSEKGRCPHCKAPWQRQVETQGGGIRNEGTGENLTGDRKGDDPQDYDRLKLKGATRVFPKQRWTVGWEPTCECPEHEPERSVVLDPFSGSATTGAVAMQLGRNYIGLDLQGGYLELAKARLEGRKPPSASPEDDEPDLIGDLFGGPSDKG